MALARIQILVSPQQLETLEKEAKSRDVSLSLFCKEAALKLAGDTTFITTKERERLNLKIEIEEACE